MDNGNAGMGREFRCLMGVEGLPLWDSEGVNRNLLTASAQDYNHLTTFATVMNDSMLNDVNEFDQLLFDQGLFLDVACSLPTAPDSELDPFYTRMPDANALGCQNSLSNDLSNGMTCTMQVVMRSMSISEEQQADCFAFLSSLWHYWVQEIAPFLTPFGDQTENPLLEHACSRAERSSEVLIAILFLSHTIRRRNRKESPSTVEQYLQRVAKDFLRNTVHSSILNRGNRDDGSNATGTEFLLTLTSLMLYCMAYYASNDSRNLILCMEFAITLCQNGFKILAEHKEFLYLSKLLGFMQNSILFSAQGTQITAPDYLSAALECPDQHAISLGGGGSGSSGSEGSMILATSFRDIDMFSGMSPVNASIIYSLGTLLRKKAAGLNQVAVAHGEWMRVFESDIDGLEARLRRHVAIFRQYRRPDQQTKRKIGPQSSATIAAYLRSYNEALMWCAWAIFLTDIKQSAQFNSEVQESVESALDACADIPRNSGVAPLIVFPLAASGMRAVKPVYREFVLTRLQDMKNKGLTDVQSLCDDLTKWWDGDGTPSSAFAFTRHFIF